MPPAGGSWTPDPLLTQTAATKSSPRSHEVFFLRKMNPEKQIRVTTRTHGEGISNRSRRDEGQENEGRIPAMVGDDHVKVGL